MTSIHKAVRLDLSSPIYQSPISKSQVRQISNSSPKTNTFKTERVLQISPPSKRENVNMIKDNSSETYK
jgi:hypothetical protein